MSALSDIRCWVDRAESDLEEALEEAQSNSAELDNLPDAIESAWAMVRSIGQDIEKMQRKQREAQP